MRTWMWIVMTGWLLVGCSSTPSDRAGDRELASADTESYLSQSDLRLHDYRGRLARMRDDLRRNRSRSLDRRKRYRELDDVEIKLNEAREDLYELRVANREARGRFRARLDNIMGDLGRSFARLNAE